MSDTPSHPDDAALSTIDPAIDDASLPQQLERTAERQPQALRDEVLPDLGMHYLLTVAANPSKRFDEDMLQVIHRRIDGADDADRTRRRRGRWWLSGLLAAIGLGLLSTLSLSADARPTIHAMVDGTWQRETIAEPAAAIGPASHRLLVQPSAGSTIELAPQSVLEVPNDGYAVWHLTSGRATVRIDADATGPTIVGTGFTSSGPGQWIASSGSYRGRIEVVAGTPGFGAGSGDFHNTAAHGETWDTALGAQPRPLSRTAAARLPLMLTDDEALGANLLADRTDGSGTPIAAASPLRIPFMAPGAYDLRITLQRRTGEDSIAVLIPRMNAPAAVLMIDGWKGTRHGFSLIGGSHDGINPSAVWCRPLCRSEQPVVVDLQIRDHLIGAYIDGELLSWIDGQSAVPPLASLEWPSAQPGELMLQPRRDRFDVLGVEFRMYEDGEAVVNDMYGPQL